MRRLICSVLLLSCLAVTAAVGEEKSSTVEIYGFVMMEAGYDVKRVDPQWFDVLRPTRLPSFEGEFGPDGNAYFGVRQTRFGVRSTTPTDVGDLKTTFEWELFGVGLDAGQTTIRLRHAYGELGKFGAGQWWSPFMDIGVFPNTIEYWGPNGMVFFRNVQVRYMPLQGDTYATVALERPGANADGSYETLFPLQDVQARFPLPDLSAEYHVGRDWGYVELAGIVRYIDWEDVTVDSLDLSGDAVGWGLNLSSNLKILDDDTLRLSVVYGEAIENYMNDATFDIGAASNPDDPTGPTVGKPLPMVGVVAFLDHSWNERFSSAIGYSMLDIDNTDASVPSHFSRGHYAIANLLHYPAPNVMAGVEVQYGKRENFSDGFTSDTVKVQFSFRYNFSRVL